MIEYEIIKQLRIMRMYEREKLLNSLHTQYLEDKNIALQDIREELTKLTGVDIVANEKYDKVRNNTVFTGGIDTLAEDARVSAKNLQSCRDQKKDIEEKFEAVHDRNIKLREFDIETERMILASMCGVEDICGNKKVLPQLSE